MGIETKVFCDNICCRFIDEYGCCSCDKLSISDNECEGPIHGSGRTLSREEELEEENDKLRELLADTYLEICAAYIAGRPLEPYRYDKALQDIGIEVGDGED